MLNQEEFIKRLHQVFKYYQLTAAIFADEIKVQRSSISHLLSGRNKPSLEFVLKIVSHYHEVTLDWLLHGKGTFPAKDIKEDKKEITTQANLFNTIDNNATALPNTSSETIENSPVINDVKQKTTNLSEVERIVVFYTNGTFKEYLQAKS